MLKTGVPSGISLNGNVFPGSIDADTPHSISSSIAILSGARTNFSSPLSNLTTATGAERPGSCIISITIPVKLPSLSSLS